MAGGEESAACRSSPPMEADPGQLRTAHAPPAPGARPAARPERGGWLGEEQVVVPCGQRAGGGSPSGLAERGSGMFIPTVAAPRERRWRRAATVLSGGALLAVAACGLLSENTVRSGLLAYGGYSYGTTYAPAYSPWGAAPAPAYMPQYAQPAQGYGQMLAPAPLPMEGSYQQGIAQSLAPFTSHLQLPSEVGAADGAADGAQGWSTGRVRFELSRVIQEEALSTQ
ncbi:hypothetical protein T484DRAFT_1901676, partial [Baffinella frigidus]